MKTTAIQDGRFEPEHNKELPEHLAPRERIEVIAGDLLITCAGPRARCGVPALVRRTRPRLMMSGKMYRIRPDDRLLSEFLELWLRSPEAQQCIDEMKTGISDSGLNLTHGRFIELPVPVPPPAEQRRIVDLLEDHLSRLHAAAADLSSAMAKLRALRDRLVISAITGTEAAERFPANLDDVGAADGDLPSLPGGWAWSRLGDVADVVGGVTKDAKKQSDPSYVDVPYLRVANVQRGYLNLDDVSTIRVDPAKAESLLLQPGDVLLNEGGDRNKLARGWVWEGQVAGCIHQNHVFRARVHEPRLDPYFLSWTANTIGGGWAERNGKQSVNLASISLSMMKRMPVIIPAAGEAVSRVKMLTAELDALERLASSLASAQLRGAALRRSLLAAAFAGQLAGSSELIQ